MSQPPVQVDPLNSPYPVPWNWVLATLTETESTHTPALRYYRSPSLISPDGCYAAYSRIQVRVSAEYGRSQVSSVLFLENLRTKDLQTITASSPFADNPFAVGQDAEVSGTIAMLIPIAWSAKGDRILAREFESLFGSDLASDFAVVWDRPQNRTYTIAPTQVQYTNAILLGWSQSHPDHVLFRAGNMGDEHWSMLAVDLMGQTAIAPEDHPVVFGQMVNHVWAGPQSYRR